MTSGFEKDVSIVNDTDIFVTTPGVYAFRYGIIGRPTPVEMPMIPSPDISCRIRIDGIDQPFTVSRVSIVGFGLSSTLSVHGQFTAFINPGQIINLTIGFRVLNIIGSSETVDPETSSLPAYIEVQKVL